MSDMKPGIVTTVLVCEQCKGKRKVLVSDGSYVLCACTLESVESSEARISGLERLFLRHEGMDMTLLGEPKPAEPAPIPFVQCAYCNATTPTKWQIVIDPSVPLPRGATRPAEYDCCSVECAEAWLAIRKPRKPGPCAEALSVEDITIGSLLTHKTTDYPWFADGSRVTKILNRGWLPTPYVEMDLDPVCPGGSTIVDDNDVHSGRIVIDNTQVGTKVPR